MNIDNFGLIQLVILQPTPFCNLDCDYCYLPERRLRKKMDLALLEPICQALLTSPFIAGLSES